MKFSEKSLASPNKSWEWYDKHCVLTVDIIKSQCYAVFVSDFFKI